mmetsp:Transcript_87956/g.249112  ORF Transcript_87956/g.249112 Transcript_87956/m.249112 type:complete len:698 (-) Transcript_87956:318-2411(-)
MATQRAICASLGAAVLLGACSGGTVTFSSSDAGPADGAPTGMSLVSRVYAPYGTSASDLAYGMGAAEQMAYDPANKYAYTLSEQGVVHVIDYDDASSPQVLSSYVVDLDGSTLTDVEVCGQMLFVGVVASTKTDNGMVKVYSTVLRSSPAAPALLQSVTVGPLPDMLLASPDCTILAVANEGEGSDSSGTLVDPEGSVSLVDLSDFSVSTVSLSTGATDAELEASGVHLPLSLNAMEYFDDYGAASADLNWTSARAAYTPATQLEPEYLAWSSDGSKLYVNLQENSALATVLVADGVGTVDSIEAYGLKDWSSSGGTEGIDTVEDGACTLEFKPGFKTMRMPDAIAIAEVDGTPYIFTADEGDDKEYDNFEEKQKFKDVLEDGATFSSDFPGFNASGSQGMADAFTNFGDTKMRITIGSAGVDYSTPSAPTFKGAVGFGGRGISIYDVSGAISRVWDSGSSFEKEQCAAYPWAHNAIQDEEFSSVWGVLYNSSDDDMRELLDEMNDPDEAGCDDDGSGQAGACPLGQTVDERSLKDGAGPEAIVLGVACGRLLAVTATEKQGTAFVYDVTDPTQPSLLFLQHLSTASETASPGVAYAAGTLGDIDPESSRFLSAAESPTGNAGIMFAGAWSGTISFYEFTCGETVTSSVSPSGETSSADASTSGGTTTEANDVSAATPGAWLGQTVAYLLSLWLAVA